VLLSLILFGSRARGDHHTISDIDLLGMVGEGTIKRELTTHGASFYQYPLDILQTKSDDGDLFVLHLTLEGKVLYDPEGIFANVCKRFRYRASYDREIREASSIIWFIADRPNLLHSGFARKRLVWALRTILIARSTEQQGPAFSSSALARFAGNIAVKSVIDQRSTISTETLCDLSKEIASGFGHSRSILNWPTEAASQALLLSTLGGVAKSTVEELQQRQKDRARGDYP
jgi:predicted nucleotidyltransferase